MATPESKRGPVRLYAFKVGAKSPFPYPKIVIPPVPKPPEQNVSEEIIRKGEKLYGTFVCDGCHSPGLDGSGAWVLDGAIHAYVIDGAWKAYKSEQAAARSKPENH